jgi:hypothetical protein
MRGLLAVGVSVALLLGPSAPASAAKSHHRAMQNFHGANAAVVRPNLDARHAAWLLLLFSWLRLIPADQNRDLDPSNCGG